MLRSSSNFYVKRGYILYEVNCTFQVKDPLTIILNRCGFGAEQLSVQERPTKFDDVGRLSRVHSSDNSGIIASWTQLFKPSLA